MAEYNVDIQVRAKTQQAAKGLTDVEAQITGIIKKTEQAERKFNGLGKALKGFGGFASSNVKTYGKSLSVLDKQLGGLGKRLGDVAQAFDFSGKTVVGISALNALGGAAAWAGNHIWGLKDNVGAFGQGLSAVTSPIHAVTNAVQAMGPAGMATAGGIAAATAAFMAFAPAAAKAVGPSSVRRVQELAGSFNRLDEEIKATAGSFESLIKDSTLNQLNAQLEDAKRQIGEYRSNTEEARISAQQLVAVTKRQAIEQRAINDLVRQAKGITQTELQEAKAIKTMATIKKRTEFLEKEAKAARETAEATRRLEQARSEEAKKNLADAIDKRRKALEEETRRTQEAIKANYELARSQDILADKRANAVLEMARQRRMAGSTMYGPGGAGPATAGFAANVEAARAVQAQNAAFAEGAKKRIQWERKVNDISTSLRKQLNSLRVRQNAAIYRLEQRRIKRLADQQKQADKERAAFRENLALGVGFPLLFGGGAGSVAGSAIGSFFGTGFGGQILGGAIGAQLDAAVQRAVELGNAIRDINLDSLKESGIVITGNLETQVALYKKIGDEAAAQALLAEQVTLQTGVFAESQQDIANAGNQLSAAWGTFTATISNTIGLLATPFTAALTGILNLVSGINKVVNFIISGLGLGIKRAAEFVIEFTLGEDALGNINAWITMFNDKLDESVLLARELFAEINQRIVNKDIELKFLKQRRVGNTLEDRVENINLDRRQKLEKEVQSLSQKRIDTRERLNKADKQTLQFALDLLQAESDRQKQLINLRADKQIEQAQNREALKQERERQRTLKQSASELDRSRKSGESLLRTLEGQVILIKGQTPLERDLAKAKNTYANNQARINELLDDSQKTRLNTLNNDILQLSNAQAYTDELKRQNEEFYKRAGLKPSDLDEFSQPVDVGLAFGGKSLLGEDERLEKAKKELEKLLDPINQVQTAAEGISGAFTNSFSQLIQGSMSAQEALANFFRRVSDAFLDMAAQIITKMVVIKALESAISIFGSGGGLFKGAGPVEYPSGLNLGSSGFAPGLNLKPMAKGGSVSANSSYLVGEKGPELFVPGAQGSIVPNNAMGGVQVGTINISVENTGEQLSPAAQKQIANQVQGIVMATLVNERRSGGVLR